MGTVATARTRSRSSTGVGVVLSLGVAAVLATGAPAAEAATGPDTRLVSVATDGGPANGKADRPTISGNGRYVSFDSYATNLVNGVSTSQRRVYRRDLGTGHTDMVSVASGGAYTNAWSSFSWPSDDGQVVGFVSDATDLTSPTTVARSVFVRDYRTGTTELISRNDAGKPANGASSRPMVSASGRYVAFSSFGANLSAVAGNGQEQVYLRDRAAGTTRLVSTSYDGAAGNARSYRAMVSDDGRYVSWTSSATNLVNDGGKGLEAIYLRDLVTGTTTRVSGEPTSLGGSRGYFSPDASYVVYNSYGAALPADTNGKSDVYVWTRATGRTELASVNNAGTVGNGDSLRGVITDDGAKVFFNSFAGNLAANDKNASGDVFLRNRTDGTTKLVSVSWFGGGADGQSFRPVPDNDGSDVTFLSAARNLVQGDTSSGYQVYVVSPGSVTADTTAPTVSVASPAGGAQVASPVAFSGAAGDDRGVKAVYVQVRNNSTGLWLRADGTWASTAQRLPTTLSAPQQASTQWSARLPLSNGSYGFSVVAQDLAGNTSTSPWRTFSVSG